MTPNSSWPLTKTQVAFLRRMRDDRNWCWAGYSVPCYDDFKPYRKGGNSYSGQAIKQLGFRGLLIRNIESEKVIRQSGKPHVQIWTMTFKVGKVLDEWDAFERGEGNA